jgi:hypothetical protein
MNTRIRTNKPKIVTVYTILIFSTLVFAHGNEQHVMGTVAKIEPGSISVRTTTGDVKSVMVLPETKFAKGSSPATQQDLKVGDRVVIHAKPEGSRLHATEVKIGTDVKGTEHQH